MRVVYLLPGTHLFGGVKVALQHVRGLLAEGIEAVAVSPDREPVWFEGQERLYRRVSELSASAIGPADIVVATFWTTVPIALEIAANAFHLCQGYEALHVDPGSELRSQVEEVYRLPLRTLAISSHLVTLLEREYGRKVYFIPQPFRPDLFYPPASPRPDDGTCRLLLSGQWRELVKGVAWAARELQSMIEEQPGLRLVRISRDEEAEELLQAPESERHVQVLPRDVPEIVRGCDVYLGANQDHEGFGLPALEAFGCGLPAVLSDTSAHRSLDPEGRASLRFPLGDGRCMREALRRLRDDRDLRRQLGTEARRIAEAFNERRTARSLIEVFEEALGS